MYTIGKLAHASDTSPDTLRYYEREGLLRPAGRSASSYRLYDDDALRRLRFIRKAQACGFTLTEIKELLALRGLEAACCGDVRSRALEKKLRLEANIRAMKAMSSALDSLISDCAGADAPLDECPILGAFESAAAAAAGGPV